MIASSCNLGDTFSLTLSGAGWNSLGFKVKVIRCRWFDPIPANWMQLLLLWPSWVPVFSCRQALFMVLVLNFAWPVCSYVCSWGSERHLGRMHHCSLYQINSSQSLYCLDMSSSHSSTIQCTLSNFICFAISGQTLHFPWSFQSITMHWIKAYSSLSKETKTTVQK